MASWHLATLAAAQAVAAGAYMAVAFVFGRRRVSPALRLGHRAFLGWWIGAGAFSATTAMVALMLMQGPLEGSLALAMHGARILSFAAAASGLVTYVLFMYRARWPFAPAVIGSYMVLGAWILSYAWTRGPMAYHVHDWLLEVHYAQPLVAWQVVLTVGLLAGPVEAAAIAYLGLLSRAADAEQRRRILLIGGSLLAWFSSTLIAIILHADALVFLASVALGLFSAGAALIAYWPSHAMEAGPVDR